MELDLFGKDGNQKPETQDDIINFYFDVFIELNAGLYNEMYLKGNILLNKLIGANTRTTKDLDFSIINKEIYESILKPRLELFGNTILEKDIEACSFEIKELSERKSGGIIIKDEKNSTLYGIDISLGTKSIYEVTSYEFSGKHVQGSTINKIIADKCLATLSRSRFRRIKDFYDLYVICSNNIEYDIDIVKQIMIKKKGIEEVETLLNNFPFNLEVLTQLKNIWDTKFSLETRTETYKKPEFTDLLNVISVIYNNLK